MKYTIDLDNKQFLGPYEGNSSSGARSVPLATLIDNLSNTIPFKTGLIPLNGSGLLSIQRAMGFEQIIFQYKPAIEFVAWGSSESQQNKPLYELAMPWRVVIADFQNGQLLGARHFFSPIEMTDWNQQLYAIGLPNTNTTGYRGTSIGWICLYHTADTKAFTFAQRIDYIIHRVSALSEPYNNNNMSGTDGPRFYAKMRPGHVFSDPSQWAKMTKTNGIDWVLEESVLIPITTNGKENHHSSYLANGSKYTLNSAANEPYSAYYSDDVYVKPFMTTSDKYDSSSLMAMFNGQASVISKAAPVKVEHFKTPKDMHKTIASWGLKEVPLDVNIDKLLNGAPFTTCYSCGNMVLEKEAIDVMYNWHVDGPNIIESSIEYHKLCQYCADEHANMMPDGKIANKDAIIWSELEEQYIYLHYAIACVICGDYVSVENSDNSLIHSANYSMAFEDPLFSSAIIGCALCCNDSETEMDYFLKKRFLSSQMFSYTIKQLKANTEGHLQVIDTVIRTTKVMQQCQCGLFDVSNELSQEVDGKITCLSCIKEDGTYECRFELHEKSVSISTSNIILNDNSNL